MFWFNLYVLRIFKSLFIALRIMLYVQFFYISRMNGKYFSGAFMNRTVFYTKLLLYFQIAFYAAQNHCDI